MVGGGGFVGYRVSVGALVAVGTMNTVAVAGMRVGGMNWKGVGCSGPELVLVTNSGVRLGVNVVVAVNTPPIGVNVAVASAFSLWRGVVPHSRNPAQ